MKKKAVITIVLFSVIAALSAVPTVSHASEEMEIEVCQINATNFPDENFRFYISREFDTNLDSKLSTKEVNCVEKISVGEMNITSLKGVEYFVNTKEIYCYKNAIKYLDISANTALERLDCYNNNLEELNLSENTNLKYINCCKNILKSINVKNNKALEEMYLDNNLVDELSVSENTELIKLSCGSNRLKILDIKNNKKLIELYCDNNQLTGLDTSNNTSMTYCDCSRNQCDVEVDENDQIDLSKLPGEMDVSKTDGWTNATLDGQILSINKGVSVVTYNYNIGRNQNEQFTLHIINNQEEITTESEQVKNPETTTDEINDSEHTTEENKDYITEKASETSSKSGNSLVKKKTVVKKISKVKIKSAKKKLILFWKKNKTVSGYQVQISTSKKFKKAKTKELKKSKNKYIFKGLKNKKRYYIRVRAYVIYNNIAGKKQRKYGKWVAKNKKTK